MWKSLVIGFISFPVAFLAFVIGLAADSFKAGFISGATVLSLGIVGAVVKLLTTKRLTLGDVFLPIPVAVVWSVILSIFTFGAEVFTAPACIGSSILLSICLWMIYQGSLPMRWAIVPAAVFAYEMLPVNIPGPIDDYFSLGGDAAFLLFQGIMFSIQKDHAALVAGNPDRRLNP